METVLILHGWGASSQSWVKVKGLLEAKGYKVVVPDLPGFGESNKLSQPWTIDDYVEWIKNFCETNNLLQIFLLGHSFGGSLAIKFSLAYPEKVKKLILVDSAGIRRKTIRKEITKKIANLLSKFSFLPFYSFVRRVSYKIIRSDYLSLDGVMKQTYLNVIGEDLSERVSGISVPSVLIWGENDRLTPLPNAYLIRDRVNGAKLEVIASIGHNPHSEAPDILAEKVLNFIKP